MLCLGIEGTAHTVGVGIVESIHGKCKIHANIISAYHPKTGGIHPREAANHHAEIIPTLLLQAIEKTGLSWEDIDIVSFSKGPGLGPCLRTAATAARSLALTIDRPIIGVNHCVAHLEIGCGTTGCIDPVLLYVSGGNTQVIAFANHRYRVFGETLDIGIGNMLDKFGREIGIEFPAGGKLEKMASRADPEKYIMLPYSVKGMDVSFSGILTACLNLHKKRVDLNQLAYSIQETTFAMVTEISERAMAHVNKKEILLGGGVACNRRLQEMVKSMARERGAKMYVPEKSLCIDNGAMIAWLGILMAESGIKMKLKDTIIDQKYRTDDVNVLWR